jgi:glycosyltransferase involved in cell wall biosynthesis
MLAAIRACAVVVVPSLWPEVLPTIALEALAAGRPVLGTAVGGIPDAIGDAGWTVPPTVDALSDALPRALAAAPSRSAAARQRYLTRYHPTVVTAQLLTAYASLPVDPSRR